MEEYTLDYGTKEEFLRFLQVHPAEDWGYSKTGILDRCRTCVVASFLTRLHNRAVIFDGYKARWEGENNYAANETPEWLVEAAMLTDSSKHIFGRELIGKLQSGDKHA